MVDEIKSVADASRKKIASSGDGGKNRVCNVLHDSVQDAHDSKVSTCCTNLGHTTNIQESGPEATHRLDQ